MSSPLPRTSELLLELHDAFPGEDPIELSEVLKKLEGRAIGLLLLALAAPNCIPNIPGISTIFGLFLIPPALQLIFGAGSVWLPKKIAKTLIMPSTLRAGIEKFTPSIQKIEKLFKPRLGFLTSKYMSAILGIEVLILAGILMLPIPFANLVPGWAVAITGIGLIQKDGLLIIISNIIFLISLFVLAPLGIGAGLAAFGYVALALHNFFANFIH